MGGLEGSDIAPDHPHKGKLPAIFASYTTRFSHPHVLQADEVSSGQPGLTRLRSYVARIALATDACIDWASINGRDTATEVIAFGRVSGSCVRLLRKPFV